MEHLLFWIDNVVVDMEVVHLVWCWFLHLPLEEMVLVLEHLLFQIESSVVVDLEVVKLVQCQYLLGLMENLVDLVVVYSIVLGFMSLVLFWQQLVQVELEIVVVNLLLMFQEKMVDLVVVDFLFHVCLLNENVVVNLKVVHLLQCWFLHFPLEQMVLVLEHLLFQIKSSVVVEYSLDMVCLSFALFQHDGDFCAK